MAQKPRQHWVYAVFQGRFDVKASKEIFMALTGKKRLFADALLAGKSNKLAALVAGYSPATASAAGSRLAKDKDVLAHIARKKASTKANPGEVTELPKSTDSVPVPFNLDLAMAYRDPRAFLLAAMNDIEMEPKLRIDAAKALMPFEFAKKGETSRKDEADVKKKAAASGRFGRREPPKLVASGGNPV